jgi:hypothetical protein
MDHPGQPAQRALAKEGRSRSGSCPREG